MTDVNHPTDARPQDRPLRTGWTTGACAATAAAAAWRALLTGAFAQTESITLPRGETPVMALSTARFDGGGAAAAGVIKDAGDDPDVTHGAEILSTVAPGPKGSGITFAAGPGVGTVTRPGLPLAVGEPAINPMPRRIIADALAAVAAQCGGPAAPDLSVTVAIPGGESLAEKTLNGRLGILGGLSVLGTTGVVIPYSCSSWIHSIHRGVDVARACGHDHLAAATGRTSERVARDLTGLPDEALIDMGDFAGGLLKYLRRHPVPRLTITGGFAKMAKLAQGRMDLHSSRSRLDLAALAGLVADPALAGAIAQAATGGQALALAREAGVDLGTPVARQAKSAALAVLAGGTQVDVVVIDRAGTVVGRSDG